ncbi:SAVMC3_10250 family protein [Streptomyces hygroscopicus]|uniref:Uncharacterized protein n=1 Tax=Streptomyces demainii TaxID=588122 RepID=A0ABT9KHL9_9ACTN|nr:SAVMC3_10250 family protein [Streptomyces demainii]MDP9607906.1 hypothetical protein [Streptomyces demainii]
MRDLLYLSENKMRALVPQLSGRLRRRLGLEAGFNAGVASVKATLPSDAQPSSAALLDAVVNMIERARGFRSRTDGDLQPGDWIRFEEAFHYGDAPGRVRDEDTAAGLVYFAAKDGPPFVLLGSGVHVLDRWQSEEARGPGRPFYMDAIRAYARRLAELPDEAATGEFEPLPRPRRAVPLRHAMEYLCDSVGRWESPWVSQLVQLGGHARVLAVEPMSDGTRSVLATPLYVEYTQRR